jgi:hypothetical protein
MQPAPTLLPAAFSAQTPETNNARAGFNLECPTTLFLRSFLWSAEAFSEEIRRCHLLTVPRAFTTGRLALLEPEVVGIRVLQ